MPRYTVARLFRIAWNRLRPAPRPHTLLRQQYLESSGWNRSAKERVPVDRNGDPIPWITYPAIEFLKGRVKAHMAVFEYGAGNSTLWWASRVARLVSCEHDSAWYDRIRHRVPRNVEMRHVPLVPDGEYCRVVASYGAVFDIVVIDGRDRVNCAFHSVGALRSGGVVVWDNTDRAEYAEGMLLLHDRGFRQLDFDGPGALNPYGWRTSVFYRSENCLAI